MKRYLFLSLIFIFNLFFYACPEPLEPISCISNKDCGDKYSACYNGHCSTDACFNNIHDCGNGICITGSDIANDAPLDYFECKCDDNAVFYEGICVLTCDEDSNICKDFSSNNARGYSNCNLELGHCDRICKGVGSCGQGFYCSDAGKCEDIEGHCETTDDCKDRSDGKIICNSKTHKCEEKPITKEDFINSYAEVACQKYFECNTNIDYNLYPDAYKTMDECKSGNSSKLNRMLNSEMCTVYDGSFTADTISCTNDYTCSNESNKIDEGFSSCFYSYFMDICKDGEGKNEASKEMARVYCENLFNCQPETASQRFKDLNDCKINTANDAYAGMIYDNVCPNFNKDLFANYISCMDNLTCQQERSECQTEFNNACK